ncbi:hypothetical protein N7451_004721 [Penicillium sp. IBT 35674x]|nr:hypothetical protein N7451_004721 [Penicillium sp. IBT 35674x]
MAPSVREIREILRRFVTRHKPNDPEILDLARKLEQESDGSAEPSLAASSLRLKEIQDAVGIQYTDTDHELNLVLPLTLPSKLGKLIKEKEMTHGLTEIHLVSRLRTINAILNKSAPNEANIRFKINDLLFYACLVATSQDIASVRSISLQTESPLFLPGVKHQGKKWNLNGKPDYAVWYGEVDDVAVNVVIVEAKAEGRAMTGLPQALGYMGIVHRRRKLLGKKDCTVYGICCDNAYFVFLKLDNHSRWSERPIIARNDEYETVFGLMVFMMKKAMLLSPMHSKESSAQTHAD